MQDPKTPAVCPAAPCLLDVSQGAVWCDPQIGSGKPTITPKTPFKVKDLHGGMRLCGTIDPCLETVDNRVFAIDGDVESRRSKKSFPQYER